MSKIGPPSYRKRMVAMVEAGGAGVAIGPADAATLEACRTGKFSPLWWGVHFYSVGGRMALSLRAFLVALEAVTGP